MRKMQNGFTLIEIMIVLVIIGIVSSVVTLNLTSSSYPGFMAEATKLSSTFEIISDEAVYTDSVIVCTVSSNSLACQTYRDGEWNEVNLSNLVAWGWPKDIQILQVVVNGARLKDNEKIRFYANNENAPMSFQITNGKYTAWIDSKLSGEYKVSN